MATRLIGTDSDDPWLPDVVKVDLDRVPGRTVDFNYEYRVILFTDGTVRAIPFNHVAPVAPTGLVVTPYINQVKFEWTAVPMAHHYNIYRNGGYRDQTTSTLYRDSLVTVGATYTYQVHVVDIYGLRSPLTEPPLTAFIDPALNNAPTVEVSSWPPDDIALGNTAIIRINAFDIDSQQLNYTMTTDIGELVATADPTVWLLTPA